MTRGVVRAADCAYTRLHCILITFHMQFVHKMHLTSLVASRAAEDRVLVVRSPLFEVDCFCIFIHNLSLLPTAARIVKFNNAFPEDFEPVSLHKASRWCILGGRCSSPYRCARLVYLVLIRYHVAKCDSTLRCSLQFGSRGVRNIFHP